jgi:hypothetical protein
LAGRQRQALIGQPVEITAEKGKQVLKVDANRDGMIHTRRGTIRHKPEAQARERVARYKCFPRLRFGLVSFPTSESPVILYPVFGHEIR